VSTVFYDSLAPYFREYADRRRAYLDAVDALVAEGIRGRTLLDVGSGDGVRILAIARRTGIEHLTLSEPSGEMRRRCVEADLVPGARVLDVRAEDLDRLDERFDSVTCLWNVLGHVDSRDARVRSLRAMAGRLSPGGTLQFDVNNRHNVRAYGWRSAFQSNGDRTVEIVVGGATVRGRGYLFARAEVDAMLAEAGLRVIRRVSVDYKTGQIRATRYEGQLFYEVANGYCENRRFVRS
jgi:2-polyprenyl-3-methyl-5-hydroxy-6-metoxy-1,4-benzoquinol methylase